MSEARADRLEDRLDRFETDIKAILGRLEPMIVTIHATLPHLATKAELATAFGELKAELADKPNRAELWWMVAAMTGGFAVVLTALSLLQHGLR